MTRPINYPARHELARRWADLAQRQLRTGQWRPAPQERRIAAELAGATRCVSQRHPPHTGEALEWRLLRLAHCASALRLAAMAGGWPLPDTSNAGTSRVDEDRAAEGRADGGVEEPGPDTVVTLSALIAAIYPTAEAAERWSQMGAWRSTGIPMEEEFPEIGASIDALELFWDGFGAVGMLFYVAATGDVDF